MKTLIISTVGISLLTNYLRSKGIRELDVDSIDKSEVLKFIDSEPHAASAETNSLLKIIDELNKEGITTKDLYFIFLVSETKEGEFCAEILSKYFSDKMNIPSFTVEIEGLRYDEKAFVYKGLMKLLEEVVRIVREHKGKRIIINATGGFKAEIAYLTIIGALLGLEIYYIHEKFREIVKLPRLPIKIDEKKLEEFLKIVNLISKVKVSEVDKVAEKLGVNPELIVMGSILTEEDGESYLVPSPLYLLLRDMLE